MDLSLHSPSIATEHLLPRRDALAHQNSEYIPQVNSSPSKADASVSRAEKDQSDQKAVSNNQSASQVPADTSQQSQEVQQVIQQLKARDTEVRAHEQAHIAAGGTYVSGGATYTYQTGPDGRRYAIGGEVGIDTSPIEGDPEATLQKAMVIQRAALAPAEPSQQDLRVASQATQMAAQARTEIAADNSETLQSNSQSSESQDSGSGTSVNSIEPKNNETPFISVRNEFETRVLLQA